MKKKNKVAPSIEFEKLQGTENDFIFIDARSIKINKLLKRMSYSSKRALAKKICHRTRGVGADGAVFVEENDGLLGWDFYNSDGSSAEMCGNAARCMALWVFKKGLAQSGFSFLTRQGLVFSEKKTGDQFYVEWIVKTLGVMPLKIRGVEAALIQSGVPHIIVWDKKKELVGDLKLIQELRWHKAAGSSGANVTFVHANKNKIYSVSFERGVEGFTKACGTGAVAAALFAHVYKKFPARVAVQVPGGRLKVSLNLKYKRVGLEGPAKLVCEGRIYGSV